MRQRLRSCSILGEHVIWRGGRVVECGALEMRFGATQRGFESPPLRF
jgi:hypothetical protein